MQNRNQNRSPKAIWALILFFFLLAALNSNSDFPGALLAIAMYCAIVWFGVKLVTGTDLLTNLKGWWIRSHQSEADHVRRIAHEAMRRAGRDPSANPLAINDIGLLVYEGDSHPRICRLAEIPTDATHIRPFIVLNQPPMQGGSGHGIIRFNLLDDQGKLRYTSRSRYALKTGQNFVTPPTWLPLADQNPDGMWSMQVSIGNNSLFALHPFDWLRVGGEVRAQLSGDGEISTKMARLMSKPTAAFNESVSLDELLSEQAEEAPLELHGQH